jgi:CMP-N,N'-diacetyllegionaminic acid synthase
MNIKKKFKIIGFIPAKKNSTGLKNKNLKKINNLSLVELTIISSIKSKKINQTFLSSDSEVILDVGKKYNIERIKRKKSLCKKTTNANEIIEDFANLYTERYKDYKNVIVVYLQPTSPFRNFNHIDLGVKKFIKSKKKILLSLSEIKNFFKAFKINKKKIMPFFNSKYINENRQNFPKILFPNGALYIFYLKDFLKNKKLTYNSCAYYQMNKIDSLDIDDEVDFKIAKFLSKNYLKSK